MCLDVSVGFIQYKLHMYRDMKPHQNFQLNLEILYPMTLKGYFIFPIKK